MDDKTFELLEKMYIDMQDMKDNIRDIEGKMATKDDLKGMATKDDLAKIHQSIVRLENKMDANDKALYDGYKLTYEKLITLENKVDEIDKKVEMQDVEIRVIKAVKQKQDHTISLSTNELLILNSKTDKLGLVAIAKD